MGEKVSDSTTVKAPVDVVMDVINDLEAYPSWAEGVEKVEILERDAEGRPAKASFEIDAKVLQVSYTLAYTYGDNEVSWVLVEGDQLRQLDGSYVAVPQGDSTHLTYSLEADIDLPLPGFMKKRGAKQILDTGLSGVRKRAESKA